MFFNIGGAEILVVAVVALIAIGPEQLPGVMRKIGGFVSQARAVTTGLRDEFMSGMDEIKDMADPDAWMGSGSDDDPVVPRGYADRQAESEASTGTAATERRGGQLGQADVPPPFSSSPPDTTTSGTNASSATGNGSAPDDGGGEKATPAERATAADESTGAESAAEVGDGEDTA